MAQNALSQSDHSIWNQLYLWKKMVKKPDFLYVGPDSVKLKVDWKRMVVASLALGHELMEKTDFWCVDTNSRKLKVPLGTFIGWWSLTGGR